MTNDFTASLPLLQKLKDLDIDQVIDQGTQIFNKYKNMEIDQEYEKLAVKDNNK